MFYWNCNSWMNLQNEDGFFSKIFYSAFFVIFFFCLLHWNIEKPSLCSYFVTPLAQIVPIDRPNRMPNEEQWTNFRVHQREKKNHLMRTVPFSWCWYLAKAFSIVSLDTGVAIEWNWVKNWPLEKQFDDFA